MIVVFLHAEFEQTAFWNDGLPGNVHSPTEFTAVPHHSETTTDSFQFRVNDGNGFSTPATVSIVVTPVNDRPVATTGITAVVGHRMDRMTDFPVCLQ